MNDGKSTTQAFLNSFAAGSYSLSTFARCVRRAPSAEQATSSVSATNSSASPASAPKRWRSAACTGAGRNLSMPPVNLSASTLTNASPLAPKPPTNVASLPPGFSSVFDSLLAAPLALRQRVPRTGRHPARHQVVARPLRRRAAEQGRLDLQEAALAQVVADDLAELVAHHQRALDRRPAQVEVAVLHPQVLVGQLLLGEL